jgi:transcriptional regulator with XRE-family HTH domain
MRATAGQSNAWLRSRMAELNITSLEELGERCGSDKGNLSRVFSQKQRPRVDALEPLATALQVNVYEVLVRIGAVDTDQGDKTTFIWPNA